MLRPGRVEMGRRLFIVGMALMLAAVSAGEAAAQGTELDGVLGTTIRRIDHGGKTFWLAEIPMLELEFPIAEDRVAGFLSLGTTWGTKGGFSVEWTTGGGLRWRPNRVFAVHASGQFGTFVFNNYTLLGVAGFEVYFPLGDSIDLAVGAEYFNRRNRELAGFISKPQWYVSGDGVGARVGFAFRGR
jgi:hypothetical protein